MICILQKRRHRSREVIILIGVHRVENHAPHALEFDPCSSGIVRLTDLHDLKERSDDLSELMIFRLARLVEEQLAQASKIVVACVLDRLDIPTCCEVHLALLSWKEDVGS